jgi:hypothetical protein
VALAERGVAPAARALADTWLYTTASRRCRRGRGRGAASVCARDRSSGPKASG